MSELVFHTVDPRPNEAAGALALPRPFERVIGLTLNDEATIWSPASAEEQELSLNVHAFEVPELCGVRTAMAFTHATDTDSVNIGYNCHSFASYAAGSRPSFLGMVAAGRQAVRIMRKGEEAKPPLEPGQQGVIGGFIYMKLVPLKIARPDHSVIGLDETYCMQVTHDWGHLALSTYQGIFDSYQVGKTANSPRLFTRTA